MSRVICTTTRRAAERKRLVYDPRGFVDIVIPPLEPGDRLRLFACLCKLVDRLGCVVHAPDSGRDWTESVRQEAGRSP